MVQNLERHQRIHNEKKVFLPLLFPRYLFFPPSDPGQFEIRYLRNSMNISITFK